MDWRYFVTFSDERMTGDTNERLAEAPWHAARAGDRGTRTGWGNIILLCDGRRAGDEAVAQDEGAVELEVEHDDDQR